MKNLIFGLIATVFLGGYLYGQSFDEPGIKHNEGLKELLLSFDNTLSKDNVKQKTFDFLKDRMDSEDFENMYIFTDYSDPFKMLNELKINKNISTDLLSIIEKDLNQFNSTINYNDVEKIVNQKLKENRGLNENDEKIYLSFLSVAKHSSRFWDINGENGTKYLPYKETIEMTPRGPNGNIDVNYEIIKISWRKVFLCDVIADLASGFNPFIAIGASCISAVMQSDL